MAKTIGIICLVVCGVFILWGIFGLAYTTAGGPNEYRFDGVRAAEGTTLTVKNGELELVNGRHFSMDRPFRRIMDQTLWGLCFLMTLIAGITLLRLANKASAAKE